MATFTEQLAAAKRTAQISGRPITKQEVSGIAAGQAESASVRLARSKGLELEEERIETTKTLQTERLEAGVTAAEKLATERAGVRATSLRLFEEEKEESEEKERAAAIGAVGGAVAGGFIGFWVGGPVGASFGAGLGAQLGSALGPFDPGLRAISGASYICTATNETIGLSDDENLALLRFRQYVKVNHRNVLKFYLEVGPEIVKAIGDDKQFYSHLKDVYIMRVIINSESSHQERAFWIYRTMIVALIKKYTPHLLERAKEVVRNDKIKFKEAA